MSSKPFPTDILTQRLFLKYTDYADFTDSHGKAF